jgi:hypothetical protein
MVSEVSREDGWMEVGSVQAMADTGEYYFTLDW